MRALQAGFPDVVAAAHEAGVPIYVGTDAGGGIAHGLAAAEMLMLHERAGMSGRRRCWPRRRGARARGSASPGWSRAAWPTWSSTTTDPRVDLRVVRAPRRIVLRGRVVR